MVAVLLLYGHRPFYILCISRCQFRDIYSMKAIITAIKNVN